MRSRINILLVHSVKYQIDRKKSKTCTEHFMTQSIKQKYRNSHMGSRGSTGWYLLDFDTCDNLPDPTFKRKIVIINTCFIATPPHYFSLCTLLQKKEQSERIFLNKDWLQFKTKVCKFRFLVNLIVKRVNYKWIYNWSCIRISYKDWELMLTYLGVTDLSGNYFWVTMHPQWVYVNGEAYVLRQLEVYSLKK